jgi:hypothetical protein
MGTVNFVVREESSLLPGGKSEWIVWAEVPAAGGDGALMAVYDSELAATTYADTMNALVALAAQLKTGAPAP